MTEDTNRQPDCTAGEREPGIGTLLLHGAEQTGEFKGSTQFPVFQTSAFAAESAESMEAVFHNRKPGFVYTRLGNPTVGNFEQKMAKLEGGIAATACSSGSAAIAVTLLNILESGDEILAPTGLYGGTLDFFRDLAAFGIRAVYAEEFTAETIEALTTPRTKAVFCEVIGNPKLNVVDIAAVAEAAHRAGIPLVADSTTATPVLVRPIRLGADIVIHSSSKYINGHGSAISGVIVDSGNFDWNNGNFPVMGDYLRYRKGAFTARLRNSVWRDIGACLAPVNAWLNLTGLETLSLRMEKICANAAALASFLASHPAAREVNYPGLATSPFRPLAEKQFSRGMAGGIVTLRAASKEAAFGIINRLRYARDVSNIGDTKTLVIHPASTIFAHSGQSEREAAGVYDDLIRISVGIEEEDDLIADFRRALDECGNP